VLDLLRLARAVVRSSKVMNMSDAAVVQKIGRPRGRPRNFDSSVALNKIRTCFAKDGFSGTSVEDLSDATGLSTQSLYNAFGDKRAMFLRALDLEYEEVIARMRHLKETRSLGERLQGYVKAATAGYDSADKIPGIAFGAALASTTDDPEVGERLRHFQSVLDVVAADILGPNVSPSAAALLSTLAMGLCLRSRSGARLSEGSGLDSFIQTLEQSI